MKNDELVNALEMWTDLVSSGYEVPAAGQVMLEAAKRLKVFDKVLSLINEGLQTGETYDALLEAKYLLLDTMHVNKPQA